MCTLTFVPFPDEEFVLTSNRDEAPNRKTLPPAEYMVNGSRLIFPKDEKAGGTWIGISDKKRLICLLNGGFTPHERKNHYRMSRGIIVTDLLTATDALEKIGTYNFNDIEPFTLVMVDWAEGIKLYELVWDGQKSRLTEKPITPSIWSSSLLYTEEIKKKRQKWFADFLKGKKIPSSAEILHFHKTAGEGNKETAVVMDRGFVKTKSITQIVKKGEDVIMKYEDLEIKKSKFEVEGSKFSL